MTSYQKWSISVFSLVLFVLVTNPLTYKITNKIFSTILSKKTHNEGGPTKFGLILHSIVFLLLVRTSMEINIV